MTKRINALITVHYLCVVDIHREPTAWNPKHRCIIKEAGETLSVQSGTGHQNLQIRAETCNVFN